jgi:hypothetical protein
MMNRRWIFVAAIPVLGLAVLAACGSDNATITGTIDGGGTNPEGSTSDGPGSSDSSLDQKAGDGGDGGTEGGIVSTVLAPFDGKKGELAEGLVVLHNGGTATPLVTFAPLGRVVSVLPDGGTADFGSFASPTGSYALGLALDTSNNVYVAVADTNGAGASTPAAGVYKIPAAGGTPTQFAVAGLGVTFGFLNGLDFIGTDLYITDSQGSIFKANNLGLTSTYLAAAELVGDEQDCKLGNGFPIGANGITHDDANVYVVNTDKGSLLQIARNVAAGTAGAITVLKKDPALCGADGLILDTDGTFLIANNAKSKIQRVTKAGVITDLAAGKPLDGPASLWIEGTGAGRHLLVTNSAFGSAAADGGQPAPSLVSLPLP